MKKNLKKGHGFTLIEVVISIAVISIISAAIYNGYILIIRQTEAGKVKQTAALIGKQISEEIKSASENEVIEVPEVTGTSDSQVTLKLTNQIQVVKEGENYNNSSLYFDEDGNLVKDKARYTAEVNLVPKRTEELSPISIDKFENYSDTEVDSWNVYIIRDKTGVRPVNVLDDSYNNTIIDDIVVKIDITEGTSYSVGIISDLNHSFDKGKININLDLKYCIGKVTIEVDNQTKTPLNLCILNKNTAEVKNIEGVLNEYYRSGEGSKIGVLYDVNIKIDDERSDKSKPIFETSFVQNIDIN